MPLPVTPKLAGIKAVVIDDEEDSCLLLKEILSQIGAEATICKSIAEAVQAGRLIRPLVLISHIGMVKEDGYKLIRKFKKNGAEEGGQIHSIALTPYNRFVDRLKVLSAGSQMFIPKPREPAELIAAVESLAGLSRQLIKNNGSAD